MSIETEETLTGWTLDFAEDIDLPGWVPLPQGLTAAEEDEYASGVAGHLQELITETRPELSPPSVEQLQSLVRDGLAARASSDSAMVYQVWPVGGPYFVFCHVNFARAADLPDWSDLPGTVHAAEARHIGPGLQYSNRRQIEDEHGDPLDVSAIHLIFADGDYAVMVGLEEASSALITQSLVGLGLYKNALIVSRGDGSTFTSEPPSAVIADSEWPIDEDGES